MSDDTTKNLPDGDRIDTLVGLAQTMSADLQDVIARLGTLEKTVGERLFDTRPIWERALAEIAEARSEIVKVRSEMGDGFKKVNIKLDLLIEDVFAVRAENKSLGRRVDKLESNSS